MWIRKKTYNNLKKNLYNRGVLLKEAIADSAELSEMLNERDAEIIGLSAEVAELKARLAKFDRKRGADGRFTGKAVYTLEDYLADVLGNPDVADEEMEELVW